MGNEREVEKEGQVVGGREEGRYSCWWIMIVKGIREWLIKEEMLYRLGKWDSCLGFLDTKQRQIERYNDLLQKRRKGSKKRENPGKEKDRQCETARKERHDTVWHELTLWIQSHLHHSKNRGPCLWSCRLWTFCQTCIFTPMTKNDRPKNPLWEMRCFYASQLAFLLPSSFSCFDILHLMMKDVWRKQLKGDTGPVVREPLKKGECLSLLWRKIKTGWTQAMMRQDYPKIQATKHYFLQNWGII